MIAQGIPRSQLTTEDVTNVTNAKSAVFLRLVARELRSVKKQTWDEEGWVDEKSLSCRNLETVLAFQIAAVLRGQETVQGVFWSLWVGGRRATTNRSTKK